VKRREIVLDVLAVLIRMGVGVTFIAAAWHKVLDPASFALATYYYHMVPDGLLHLFALFLPWLEMVTGVAVIVGWGRRGAALLIIAMLLMFIVGLAVALTRGLDISCGCFGTDGGHAVGLSLLVRDALLVLVLGLYLWIEARAIRLSRA